MFCGPHADMLNGSAQLELTILFFLNAMVLFTNHVSVVF